MIDILDIIERRCIKGRTVAFFCPDAAFRNNFGEIPNLLKSRGFVVLYLYGLKIGGAFEEDINSFFVGGRIGEVRGVDLFITATIMDCLPKSSKKALLIHGSLAPFIPEAYDERIDDPRPNSEKFLDIYNWALSARTHFSAYARLYNYYFVSSEFFSRDLESIFKEFKLGENLDAEVHEHFKILTQGLALTKQSFPENIYVIPSGYPQIDAVMRHTLRKNSEKDTITYAPTPLNGKPAWDAYSSMYHAGAEILISLASNFNNYRVVFKPHVSDLNNPVTAKILNNISNEKNIIVDTGGSSYHDLYARSALMVSDFSSTAYTFALGTLSPVVFFSPNEENFPDGLENEAYCSLRKKVGAVVKNTDELVVCVKEILNNKNIYLDSIKNFRKSFLYNPGGSEEYITNAIDLIMNNKRLLEWGCYKNISPADFF
jgi:hypothetical protein